MQEAGGLTQDRDEGNLQDSGENPGIQLWHPPGKQQVQAVTTWSETPGEMASQKWSR